MENSTENKNIGLESSDKGGGQPGNQNARKGKLFYDALRIALVQEDKKKLRTITEKLVKSAENGEPWAIKEVMDRIDGKPIQATEISGADGGLLETLSTVNIVLKKPNGA
jgi:hypothetical protein